MWLKKSVKIILLAAFVLALFIAFYQAQIASQDSPYGTLYFPLSGGNLAFMPADCLITGSECPAHQSGLSVGTDWWNSIGWTPDGKRAYVVERDRPDWFGDKKYELFLLNPKTSLLKSLIRMSYIEDVSWSPDGKWLAIAGVMEGDDASTTEVQIAQSAVFIISPDGKSIINLTDGLHGMKHHLSWINQETILFEVDDYPNGCGTYALNIQNKTWTTLLNKPDCYTFPQPSPDGKLIAYVSVKGEDINSLIYSLYVMNSDGTNKTLLAEFDAIRVIPFWSPNQEWLSLNTVDKTGNSAIFIISPNGKGLHKVYQSENAVHGTWAPINEPYLLVGEIDNKASIEKWVGITIPDGEVKTLSIFGKENLPSWISWHPPSGTVSTP
jgi:Tol biopolymer transport system component